VESVELNLLLAVDLFSIGSVSGEDASEVSKIGLDTDSLEWKHIAKLDVELSVLSLAVGREDSVQVLVENVGDVLVVSLAMRGVDISPLGSVQGAGVNDRLFIAAGVDRSVRLGIDAVTVRSGVKQQAKVTEFRALLLHKARAGIVAPVEVDTTFGVLNWLASFSVIVPVVVLVAFFVIIDLAFVVDDGHTARDRESLDGGWVESVDQVKLNGDVEGLINVVVWRVHHELRSIGVNGTGVCAGDVESVAIVVAFWITQRVGHDFNFWEVNVELTVVCRQVVVSLALDLVCGASSGGVLADVREVHKGEGGLVEGRASSEDAHSINVAVHCIKRVDGERLSVELLEVSVDGHVGVTFQVEAVVLKLVV
jgi:hypothetical protein